MSTKAVKLPSGAWRCEAFLGRDKKGKRIRRSFTAPTKREAEALARKCEVEQKPSMRGIEDKDITVGVAVKRYCDKKEAEAKKEKISPSTVRGYKKIYENNIDNIADIPCIKLEDYMINEWIDDLSEELSAKSIRNIWGLVHASLMDVLPRSRVLDFRVDLPPISKKKVVVPSEEDIHRLLAHLRANDYQFYCAAMLAAFGTLRRSEICALTAEDIDRKHNIVHINKAMVEGIYSGYTLKKTKTESSERDVVLPAFVVNALPEEGKIINVLPAWITEHFGQTLQKLDIPHFRFHDLRHYSASIMHYLQIPDETIMRRGGWATDHALHAHYRGVMSEYDKTYTEKLNEHFKDKFAI